MKILISDFDKTFYTENYDNNIKLINEFVNAGNKFVIATGRPLYFLEPSIEGKNINYYNLICSDGTVIFDKNNKILFQEVIKKETIQTLIEKIRNNPHISDYYLNTAYENTKDINVTANGFLGVPIDRDESQKFIDKLSEIDENIKGYLSYKWINIISKNASKSSAIKKLIEINNWNYEDIYVAGDYYNDIDMNKDYQSFCFDFSPEELKKVSNYVVKDFSDILKKIGY